MDEQTDRSKDMVTILKQNVNQESPAYFTKLNVGYKSLTWTTTLHIDLKGYEQRHADLQANLQTVNLEGVRNLYNLITNRGNRSHHVGQMIRRMLHDSLQTYQFVQHRLDDVKLLLMNLESYTYETPAKSRDRRSFLGILSAGLGIHNYFKYRHLRKKVAMVIKKQDQIVDNLITSVKIENANRARINLNAQTISKLTTLTANMNENLDQIRGIATQNAEAELVIESAQQFQLLVTNQILLTDDLYRLLDTLEDGLAKAMLGKLSSKLFTHAQLTEILYQIEEKLTTSFRLAYDIDALHVYYSHVDAHLVISDTNLHEMTLLINIPVKDTTTFMTIYNAIPLPVYQKSIVALGKVKFESNYIAISNDNNYYMQITENEYREIEQTNIIPSGKMAYSKYERPTCISNAYFGESLDKIKCQGVAEITDRDFVHLYRNTYYIYTRTPINLKLQCPVKIDGSLRSKVGTYLIEEPRIVTFKSGCQVDAPGIMFYTEQANTIKDSIQWHSESFYSQNIELSPWTNVEPIEVKWLHDLSQDDFKEIQNQLKKGEQLDTKLDIQKLQAKLAVLKTMSLATGPDYLMIGLLVAAGIILVVIVIVIILSYKYKWLCFQRLLTNQTAPKTDFNGISNFRRSLRRLSDRVLNRGTRTETETPKVPTGKTEAIALDSCRGIPVSNIEDDPTYFIPEYK